MKEIETAEAAAMVSVMAAAVRAAEIEDGVERQFAHSSTEAAWLHVTSWRQSATLNVAWRKALHPPQPERDGGFTGFQSLRQRTSRGSSNSSRRWGGKSHTF